MSLVIRSSTQSDTELTRYCRQKLNVPGAFRTPSVDALLSWSGNVLNTRQIISRECSLTLDSPESLSSDSPILFL